MKNVCGRGDPAFALYLRCGWAGHVQCPARSCAARRAALRCELQLPHVLRGKLLVRVCKRLPDCRARVGDGHTLALEKPCRLSILVIIDFAVLTDLTVLGSQLGQYALDGAAGHAGSNILRDDDSYACGTGTRQQDENSSASKKIR